MKLRKIILATSLSSIMACSNSGSSGLASTPSGLVPASGAPLRSFPPVSNSAGVVSSNLRLSLTDAPSKDLKSVWVNVDHAELFVRRGGGQGRLVVAQNMGMVDLMTLRNGVSLPMQDMTLPVGTEISAIRLVLKPDNNHGVKNNGSRCDMKTPSAQQSGIKIHLAQPFTIEQGQTYSMIMDFDAEKSVVVRGRNGCLLKPVLKLLSVVKAPIPIPEDPSDDGGGTVENPGDTGGGTGGNTGGDTGGGTTDPGTIPDDSGTPITDGNDGNTGGGDGGATDPNTVPDDGGGFEIPVDPADDSPIITIDDLVESNP
jgi:hypothetical protein